MGGKPGSDDDQYVEVASPGDELVRQRGAVDIRRDEVVTQSLREDAADGRGVPDAAGSSSPTIPPQLPSSRATGAVGSHVRATDDPVLNTVGQSRITPRDGSVIAVGPDPPAASGGTAAGRQHRRATTTAATAAATSGMGSSVVRGWDDPATGQPCWRGRSWPGVRDSRSLRSTSRRPGRYERDSGTGPGVQSHVGVQQTLRAVA